MHQYQRVRPFSSNLSAETVSLLKPTVVNGILTPTCPLCCPRPFLSKSIHRSKSETTKVDLSAMEVDPASVSDRDRVARRPRRYIAPGDSRMSERFRTQPVTSAERLESDRYRRGALCSDLQELFRIILFT